jgi:hypothetical protein
MVPRPIDAIELDTHDVEHKANCRKCVDSNIGRTQKENPVQDRRAHHRTGQTIHPIVVRQAPNLLKQRGYVFNVDHLCRKWIDNMFRRGGRIEPNKYSPTKDGPKGASARFRANVACLFVSYTSSF